MKPSEKITPGPLEKRREPEDDDVINLSTVIGTLWRGKWIIAAFCAAFVLAAGFYVFRVAVPVYEATSVVAFDGRSEQNVTNIESVVSGLSANSETINTEMQVITSRTLGKRLVERLDLVNDPEFNPPPSEEPSFNLRATIRSALMRAVGVEDDPADRPSEEERFEKLVTRALATFEVINPGWSYVLNIKATTTSPRRSVLFANTLAELYIEDQLEVKFEATKQAAEWLSQRVADLRDQLEASEAAVKDFNASIDLISIETLDALNRQLKDMRDRLAAAEKDAAAAKTQADLLATAIEAGDRPAILLAATDPRLDRIAEDVENGRAVDASFDAQAQQVLARARLSASRGESQVEGLKASVAAIADQVEQQSRDLVTLQQLEREAEANRLIYESFLVRLREITIQQGIQKADARVISPAVLPNSPSAPRKSRIVLLSLILGLIAGSAAVLLLQLRRRGFRTAQELERATGYTVLGQIPLMPVRRRTKLVEYLLAKPTSVSAEAARNLRTSIELSSIDNPPKTIMSTSCVPAEGKTTTAILLAHHFAALDRRVLLLEGDIRRKVMDQYFDVRERKGFVSVLSGEATLDEVILRNATLGFDILAGEQTRANAADLFASQSFKSLLAELGERYDHVIIDTPPVLVVPDARSIGRHVDTILFSVKWDSTSALQLEQGLSAFESVGIRVTGLVLTHVDLKGMRRYGYGKDYGGYGYGYGHKGYYGSR